MLSTVLNERNSDKMFKKIAIAIATLVLIAYCVISYNLAKSITMPKTLTLDEERKWIEENNLLGSFDTYEKQDYKIEGYNGYTINAQLVKSKDNNSNKYVIVSHGFRSNRNGSIKYIDTYQKLGYNVIIYDVRGHGLNEKTAVSLGNIESEDLYMIIQDTYKRFGENIHLGLHGESMGSSISLSVLSKKPKLDFVVADCGFSNLYNLIYGAYKENNIGFLIYGVSAATKLGYHIDMKKTSPIDALSQNNIPICFIHGENDTFIKPKHSELMFENNKSIDELHIVPKAEHASSISVLGTDKYSEIISEFFKSTQKS